MHASSLPSFPSSSSFGFRFRRPSGQLFLPAVVPPGWISAIEKVKKIKSCLIPLLVLGTTTCATLLPTCSQDHPLARAATRNSCCERARAIMPHCAHSSAAGRPPSLTHPLSEFRVGKKNLCPRWLQRWPRRKAPPLSLSNLRISPLFVLTGGGRFRN